jgi:hypothetical protein
MERGVSGDDLGSFAQAFLYSMDCFQCWRIVERRKDRSLFELAQN